MDCFYAAVEMRDNPRYRDIPIAIGGRSDRRGVISTCNYIARKFGVKSAMATAQAMKLCPNLVVVPGQMKKYVEVSRQIRDIFARYTPLIEPLSLDEAYLDVSDIDLLGGSATLIAQQIRKDIFNETELTASAGVAPCKFVAKVASDVNKPNGICVVTPDELDSFVASLPLGKIPGVGKVTLEKLHNLGLYHCRDVREYSQELLSKRFGKFGLALWQYCHGKDERRVTVERKRKSVGVERTLPHDIHSAEECWQVIEKLLPELQQRLQNVRPDMDIHSQGIKLKFSDFQLTSIEQRQLHLVPELFKSQLQEILQRQRNRGIRLVGLQVGLPDEQTIRQLPLPFPQQVI